MSAAAAAAAKSPDWKEEANPRTEAFLGIISSVPTGEVEAALSACGIAPTAEVAEQVLKSGVCYSRPKSAVRFFRWADGSVTHTAYAWNLLVDILGKAAMFEPMWDAIRSMKQEGGGRLVSIATFASVFASYCARGSFKEAVAAFDVMGGYGLKPDAVALNSLLSAICRFDGTAQAALDVFDRTKATVPPDADTFAILLEVLENEGNAKRAKTVVGEMAIRIGWDPANVPAYDSFLSTLVRSGQCDEALKFLQVMRSKGCFPGIKFFANAMDTVIRKGDYANAIDFWHIMVSEAGIVPNFSMYNAMIGLCCNVGSLDHALGMLDEMPLNGVFANSVTYNAILEGFIKHRKAREAESFLKEMSKNEQLPTASNCAAAIRLFFKEFNPSAAISVWCCVVEHNITPAKDSARELIEGLLDLGRFTEVKKRADEVIDMRVELSQSTIENMKRAFVKADKHQLYDHIARRLKRR